MDKLKDPAEELLEQYRANSKAFLVDHNCERSIYVDRGDYYCLLCREWFFGTTDDHNYQHTLEKLEK